MTDRTVKVNLTAVVGSYLAGMEQARQSTRNTGTEADKAKAKFEAQGAAMSSMGRGLLAFGAIAAVGVALAVKKFADFDKAMSEVQASTHESADNMGLLRDAAIAAGASTVFSATEAANAIDELAKAGISTADILGGALDGALALASAGSLGVADAAAIAATALTQFKLKGEDVPHVADLLAAGAGKAQGSVQDLAAALNQGGLVVSQAGFSIEETTGTLAAFASAGLLGSDAGTSLKTAILALEAPAGPAQRAMDKYGISVYDSSGKMISFAGIAEQLKTKLGGLTEEQRNSALATIFGTDAVRSAGVLYQNGAAGIEAWNDKVNDTGYAAETARLKLDNLNGDIERLGGSFDTVLIQGGSGANEVLRSLVQTADYLVSSIGDLPQPVLAAGLGLAAIVAATSLTGGAALTAIPKIASFKGSLTALGISGKAASIGLGSIAGVASALIIILSAVASSNAEAAARTEAYGDTLDATSNKITSATREMVKTNLAVKDSFLWFEGDSTYDAADKLGISLDLVTDAATGNVDALKKLKSELDVGTIGTDSYNAALKASGLSSVDFAAASSEVRKGVQGQSSSIEEAIRVAEQKASVDKTGTATSEDLAAGIAEVQQSAEDAAKEVQDLTDMIANFGKATLDSRAASRDFEAAVDDAAKSIHDNGKTLDINTEKGRANQAALDKIATSANNSAASKYNETQSIKKTSAALESGRDEYIKTGIRMGLTRKQAKDYADQLISTPKDVITKVRTQGIPQAVAALRTFYDLARNAPVATVGVGTVLKPVKGHSGGGTIYGAGTSKSDSEIRALSVGEEVIQEPFASQYRATLKAINAGTYTGESVSASPNWAQVAGAQTSNSRNVEINYTTMNPVSKDPAASAREAAQFLAAQMES